MKQKLIDELEKICPNNVYLQGTLAEDEAYPDSFVTFWTDTTSDNAHYDDDVSSIDWSFSVVYYSSDPALVNSVPAQIRTALKAVGFIPQGRGNDIPSDRPSHTGWAMDFDIKEYL